MTREEIRAEWVRRLRSGTIVQSKSALARLQGRCCLGVLCDIAVEEGLLDYVDVGSGDGLYREGISGRVFGAYLPLSIVKWAGLRRRDGGVVKDGRALVELNDGGMSFSEIADLIESEPSLWVDEAKA